MYLKVTDPAQILLCTAAFYLSVLVTATLTVLFVHLSLRLPKKRC